MFQGKQLVALFFVNFLLVCSYMNAQDSVVSEWKLEKQKNGISIFTKDLPDSKFKKFKAVSIFDTKVEKIVSVLMDVKHYSEWMVSIRSSEVITRVSENEVYTYSIGSLPWPFDKRDVISHISLSWSDNRDTAWIVAHGVPDYIPEKEGMLRILKSEGSWTVWQENESTVIIEQTFRGEPRGNIPAWIVNFFVVESLYKTIKNLRGRLKCMEEIYP